MKLSSCILSMFGRKLRHGSSLLLVVLAWASGLAASTVQSWNAEWSFHLGDEPDAGGDWRSVRLPHDWSAEIAPQEDAAVAGHGGFAVTGIGWYERRFTVPESWDGQRVEVHFEGVYMDAELWLNGVRLSAQRNGHLPWRVDLTEGLQRGAENVLRVRVNNGDQPNARWYTGSGIIRPVWLELREPVHVVPDSGEAVTRQLSANEARVGLAVEVANTSEAAQTVRVKWAVRDPAGIVVAKAQRAVRVAAGGAAAVPAEVVVADPQPWTPDSPQLHTVEVEVDVDGRSTDRTQWSFGLRTVRVSAERGFELNGQPVKLLGGNVHADHGPLGAISLARAEEHKVELLKAAGYNAVRTAHHPPSTAFLEACDRLGLLVVNELYDGWVLRKTKQDYGRFMAEAWRRDMESWIRRDRRHPSVVMWSVGNEMYERNRASGRELAVKLAAAAHRFDGTRPTTAGVNGPGGTREWSSLDALFAAFDVAGYNYELAANHEADHARLPERVMFASESYQYEAYTNWAIMRSEPYIIGDFVWSALDYLGESGIGRVFPVGEEARKHWEGSHWPWRGSYCGDIDWIGWRKPISHYRQIVWDRGERLYLAVDVPSRGGEPWQLTPWSITPELPSWTWAGREGSDVTVKVYSRWPRVRLELNGVVIGEAPTGEAEAFRATFDVPYAAGVLVALGVDAQGVVRERKALRTAGDVTALRVTSDRERLQADGNDLAFIDIEAVDAAAVWFHEDTRSVRITIEGPGVLAALGNGDPTARGIFTEAERSLWLGKGQAIVRTTNVPGVIRVRVSAEGVPDNVVELQSVRRGDAKR